MIKYIVAWRNRDTGFECHEFASVIFDNKSDAKEHAKHLDDMYKNIDHWAEAIDEEVQKKLIDTPVLIHEV